MSELSSSVRRRRELLPLVEENTESVMCTVDLRNAMLRSHAVVMRGGEPVESGIGKGRDSCRGHFNANTP